MIELLQSNQQKDQQPDLLAHIEQLKGQYEE